jgi:hypothetical protein
VHSRAATYTFTDGVISIQPNIGNSAFTVNNGKFLPQPRVGLAWSPFRSTHATVIRAGFDMYPGRFGEVSLTPVLPIGGLRGVKVVDVPA